MKEIVTEYGRAILAGVVVVAVIAISVRLFQGQLHDEIERYDQSMYGASINISTMQEV